MGVYRIRKHSLSKHNVPDQASKQICSTFQRHEGVGYSAFSPGVPRSNKFKIGVIEVALLLVFLVVLEVTLGVGLFGSFGELGGEANSA